MSIEDAIGHQHIRRVKNLNPENWNTHFYQTDLLKAFISYSMDVDGEEEYLVTTQNNDNSDLFQAGFKRLEEAILYANNKFASFLLVSKDLEEAANSGCSTCGKT